MPNESSYARPPVSQRATSSTANHNNGTGPTASGSASSSTNGAASRGGKKPKLEEADDAGVLHPNGAGTVKSVSSPVSTTTPSAGGGRSKRATGKTVKEKENEQHLKSPPPPPPPPMQQDDQMDDDEGMDDDEDQGITRCVCGSSEDGPDAGEFMVQCEMCKVWQHGLCMGYNSEDQLDEDYYCEECKPELHVQLLKNMQNSKRRPSGSHAPTSHRAQSASARDTRSRSPVVSRYHPSKRRNTMNSRDAAFDESIKEVMEASAAEAAGDPVPGVVASAANAVVGVTLAAFGPSNHPSLNGASSGPGAMDVDEAENAKKKRKRTDEDAPPTKKRTRSASAASDLPTAREREASPPPTPAPSSSMPAPPVPAKAAANNRKRGGQRKGSQPSSNAAQAQAQAQQQQDENGAVADAEEAPAPAPPPSKRTAAPRRPGGSTRRNQYTKDKDKVDPSPSASSSFPASLSTQQQQDSSSAHNAEGSGYRGQAAKHYKNTHAYASSGQPPLSSWLLPDYLAHLEHILPAPVPRPMDVVSGAQVTAHEYQAEPSKSTGTVEKANGANSNANAKGLDISLERTIERGAKVKWPAKRMSVGDMNKRVRALVEWVVREQGCADRKSVV